jgi:molybdate transport system substrate-binding protein
MTKVPFAVAALILSTIATGLTASAAEIKVLCAGALKLAMTQLIADFQKSSGNAVTIDYSTTGAFVSRIQKGELADVAIMSGSQLELLESQGKVAPGSRVNIAGVGVGVAVRQGASKPDISSVEGFKRALFSAQSIGYANPAIGSSSGIYVAGMLERLGIAQDLKSKIKLLSLVAEPEDVFQTVARGEIDIQIGSMSEIVISPGVDLVGPLPAELQNVTVFAAGTVATSKAPQAANAFVKFIASPAAAVVLKAKGFEPG